MSVRKNYILSSNLLLISIVLGIVNIVIVWFENRSSQISKDDLFTILLGFGFLGTAAFLVRKGIWTRWIRIILLVFFILALALSISVAQKMLQDNILTGIIYLSGTVVQLWAALLLFKKDE
jgi:hypothetical protein